jgi:hypothetical protein
LAATRDLILTPDGVGGCVLQRIPADKRIAFIKAIEEGHSEIPEDIRVGAAAAASRCTGQPYSASDGALVGATVAAFFRMGKAIYIGTEFAISQQRLDAAWKAAASDEKAPFYKVAADFLDPASPATKSELKDLLPFERRLGIDPKTDPRMLAMVLEYFNATAIGERSEAQLAAKGAKPPTVLTKALAAEWFYLNVARCLFSREHDSDVEGLPSEIRSNLRPAMPAERGPFQDPRTKVWTTNFYGARVLLAELGPGKCQVIAEDLPVDATFRDVVARLRQADPNLKDEPVKPGPWPITNQLARTINASRFVVRLEGAEPGAPGHLYHLSLLRAEIERTSVADAPSGGRQ